MPQLDPTSFPSQLFWLVVTFFTFFVIMWRVGMPRVAGMVEARQNRIASDVAEMERMKAEAEKLIASYEMALVKARAEGMQLINAASIEAERMTLQAHKDLSRRTEEELEKAERRISAAKAGALHNLSPVAEELAKVMSEKLMNAVVEEDAVRKAVSTLKNAA